MTATGGAVGLERAGRARQAGEAAYARWLGSTAQAFLDEGFSPVDLARVAADPEVGSYFADIRDEMSRLLGRPS